MREIPAIDVDDYKEHEDDIFMYNYTEKRLVLSMSNPDLLD